MSGNDIFGNLDNFLEHYDEDNLASTSMLSEIDIEMINGDSHIAVGAKGEGKTIQCAMRKLEKNTDLSLSSTTRTVASPASALSASVPNQTTSSLINCNEIANKMRRICCLFDLVYRSGNPIIDNYLRTSDAIWTKRGFNALKRSYNRKPPVSYIDMKKFKKRMETLESKLVQLQNVTTDVSNPAAKINQGATTSCSNIAADTSNLDDVIILDPDDEVTSQSNPQPLFTASSNVISLDSDDDGVQCKELSLWKNNSFDAENYEMRVKVKWGKGIETFKHRKFQKFDIIINKLAEKESADTRCILLNIDDRIIYGYDTLDSIGYKPHQFICGRVLRDNVPISTKTAAMLMSNNNTITLKVQLEKRKQPLSLQIDKNQTMSVLVIKCAEELKCDPSNIRLYFDGELVNNSDKPQDLELEGDEMMDIRFMH